MKKLAVVAVVCLAFCLPQGQEPCALPKIVKTTGMAEINVNPDRAVIEVGVERQSATAESAKAAVDNTSRKILAALKAASIDEKDIQTAYLDLQPRAITKSRCASTISLRRSPSPLRFMTFLVWTISWTP